MFCEKCGANLPEGIKYCNVCGADSNPAQYVSYEPQPPMQNYGQPQSAMLTQPLSVGEYIITLLLMSIPIVNIVLMFVWGFGSNTNLNKRNYARALLIMAAISIALWILASSFFIGIIANLAQSCY